MDGFEITAETVKTLLKRGEPLFFVDLRYDHEWDVAVMKAEGALRIPDDEVEKQADLIPRDRPIVIYSTSPGDEPSFRAARFLLERGWSDVHPLVDGFKAYLEAGLPVEEIEDRAHINKIMLL
jgi:rhodanese-related sulfurtransferase